MQTDAALQSPALQPPQFMAGLKESSYQHVFSSLPGYEGLDFDASLQKYRQEVQKKIHHLQEKDQDISSKIMTQPMLGKAQEILKDYLPEDSARPLSEQFSLDRCSIQKNAPLAGQGILHKEGLKFGAKIGEFDPHLQGNLPFLVGKRTVCGSQVNILRHPVPTIEKWIGRGREGKPLLGDIRISEEFKAFLGGCKSRKEKMLYCSLLNPKVPDEWRRLNALQELGRKEFSGTFHFIRFPMDGPLTQLDGEESLESYRKRVEAALKRDLKGQTIFSDFLFGSRKISSLVAKRYQKVLDFSYAQISLVYAKKLEQVQGSPQKLQALLKERKQAFLMLVCTVLKAALIHKLQVQFYSNTCKDAIDRGSAHLVSDLVWDGFLTGSFPEDRETLRLIASWPAFMVKTQPILKHRAEWMISFTKFIEEASAQGLRSHVVKDYKAYLNLVVDSKNYFLN